MIFINIKTPLYKAYTRTPKNKIHMSTRKDIHDNTDEHMNVPKKWEVPEYFLKTKSLIAKVHLPMCASRFYDLPIIL